LLLGGELATVNQLTPRHAPESTVHTRAQRYCPQAAKAEAIFTNRNLTSRLESEVRIPLSELQF